MNIKSIKLTNFRCFKEVSLETPKLTILTGANSSGKSSLIYGILGAFQSSEFPLFYSPNGSYIDMGGYREIVYGHKTDLEFSVGMDLDRGEYLAKYNSTYSFSPHDKMPVLKSLNIQTPFSRASITKHNKYTLTITYNREKDPDVARKEAIRQLMSSLSSARTKESRKRRPIKSFREKGYKDSVSFEQPNQGMMKLASRYPDDFELMGIYSDLFGGTSALGKSVNYISSFRLTPERTYYQKAGQSQRIGKYGENYIDQLLEWEYQSSSDFVELKQHMRKLGIFSNITSKKLSGGRFEILVKMRTSAIMSHLTDVGFGISQFLPILVADLQLPQKSTLILSQPEIHLHPSVQAEFANYIAESIMSKGKRYLIETHSEYFLNRVRYLIVTGMIRQEDVKLVFFKNTRDGTSKHEIELTKRGEIKNAPEDFFKTYMIDVMNIALKS